MFNLPHYLDANYVENETVIIYGDTSSNRTSTQFFTWLTSLVNRYKLNLILCDNNQENNKKKVDGFEEITVIHIDELVESYSDCKVIISLFTYNILLEVYDNLIKHYVNKDHIYVAKVENIEMQYFDSVIQFSKDEIFVDAGVSNGNTSVRFVNKCNHKYKKLYLIEPRSDMLEVIWNNLGRESITNYELFHGGLWDEVGQLTFDGDLAGGSRISEKGETTINTTSLDELTKGEPVTFIKMDIEGAELKALIGAKETIQKYKPKLAICIYHKREDSISIPLYIKSLVPEYKLYMRQYSNQADEGVLYAVL